MKKILPICLLGAALLSTGCSSASSASQAKGSVECYSISVVSGTTTIFSGNYEESYAEVWEYYAGGTKDPIYTSFATVDPTVTTSSTTTTKTYLSIRDYEDKYNTTSYTTYTAPTFVGWLKKETKYIVNFDSKVIDMVETYSEYTSTINPNENSSSSSTSETTVYDSANNKKAYEYSQKGYYLQSSFELKSEKKASSSSILGVEYNYYYTIVSKIAETSLERHTYIKLSDDSLISYKPKWF